ncbi:glycosyltransferase family 1 protein [Acinetobacter sp. VNK23]|uniref:glycosyltransferase family 4 protein n=1 Tax=Acinetobacter thutiue TaxID=2998078 RepID=UPI0025750BDA|nr:glycosyltransferase family 1 protein [Acinetobacter thutiue]MDM1018971.1 glycosyltransferase family 1 protein [Acinetobacter thutiue]
MKIIFDQQIFTKQKYGGISRYIFELSKNLNDIGQDVRILAPIHINSYIKNHQNNIGVYLEGYPRFTKRIFRNSNFIASKMYFRNQAKKPDILHETYYSNQSIAPSYIPKIITVHDMIHELFPENFPTQDKTSKIKKKAIQRADHVICISECTKKDLIRILNVPENKISVVYHGISELTGDGYLYINSPFFLYVGQRKGYKNFEILLQAYAHSHFLRNNFRIIAFGGGAFTNEEYQLMSALNLNLNSISQISGDDGLLKSLYQQAIALIYPSLYEGFGFPPLEAMMYGCPTIAANASCIPEITGDASLLFDPHSVDDLLEKIESILTNDMRIHLIKKGFIHHKKFTWEKCARETLVSYQSVLK